MSFDDVLDEAGEPELKNRGRYLRTGLYEAEIVKVTWLESTRKYVVNFKLLKSDNPDFKEGMSVDWVRAMTDDIRFKKRNAGELYKFVLAAYGEIYVEGKTQLDKVKKFVKASHGADQPLAGKKIKIEARPTKSEDFHEYVFTPFIAPKAA